MFVTWVLTVFWEREAMNLNFMGFMDNCEGDFQEISIIILRFSCSYRFWHNFRLFSAFNVPKLLETVQWRHQKEEFEAESSVIHKPPLTARVKHSKSGQTNRNHLHSKHFSSFPNPKIQWNFILNDFSLPVKFQKTVIVLSKIDPIN